MRSDRDFAEAFDAAYAKLRATIDSSCQERDSWADRVAHALSRVMDLAAAQPAEIRVLTVAAFDYGVYGALRYRRMVEGFAAELARGRQLGTEETALPGLIEEALVGAVAEIVAERLRNGREAELPSLAGELAEWLREAFEGEHSVRQVQPSDRPPHALSRIRRRG